MNKEEALRMYKEEADKRNAHLPERTGLFAMDGRMRCPGCKAPPDQFIVGQRRKVSVKVTCGRCGHNWVSHSPYLVKGRQQRVWGYSGKEKE